MINIVVMMKNTYSYFRSWQHCPTWSNVYNEWLLCWHLKACKYIPVGGPAGEGEANVGGGMGGATLVCILGVDWEGSGLWPTWAKGSDPEGVCWKWLNGVPWGALWWPCGGVCPTKLSASPSSSIILKILEKYVNHIKKLHKHSIIHVIINVTFWCWLDMVHVKVPKLYGSFIK